MFEDRIKEILRIIDFNLVDMYSYQLVIDDMKKEDSERKHEFVSLPCKYLSSDQERSIECVIDNEREWLQVRSMDMESPRNEFQLFRAATQKDNKNDYYTFGFEREGSMYDVTIGRWDDQDVCYYRRMDLIGKEYVQTSVFYKDRVLSVSYRTPEGVEEVKYSPEEKKVSYFDNSKLVGEMDAIADPDIYYSSLLSTATGIIEKVNDSLFLLNLNMFKSMIREYPIFQEFLHFYQDSYHGNKLEEFYNKHHIFTKTKYTVK